MTTRNPFVVDIPLDPRVDRPLFARAEELARIAQDVRGGAYYVIVSPDGGGRTSLLKALERDLGQKGLMHVVLFRPADLDLSSEAAFFRSVSAAADIAVRRGNGGPPASETAQPVDGFANAFDWWLECHVTRLIRPLVLMFDDIDQIPPNILQQLAGFAHRLFNERAVRPHLMQMRFVFASTVSLRYLTLTQDQNVSPFNLCTEAILNDLDERSAVNYLRQVVDAFDLRFRDEAIERIIYWTGGDLSLIHRLGSRLVDLSGDGYCSSEAVDEAAGELIGNGRFASNDPLRRPLFLVEDDRKTLDLVVELLRAEPKEYESGQFDEVLLATFSITYPELCGAVKLIRVDGIAERWAFRHRLAKRLAQAHFTPRRLVRLFASYGAFAAARIPSQEVLAGVRKAFEGNQLDFDGSGLTDVLLALTNQIYAERSHDAAYEAIALVLTHGFGCVDITFFDYITTDRLLKAVKFLAQLFPGNDNRAYDVEAPTNPEVGAVRAFITKLFAVDGRAPGGVYVAVPLKNATGEVTSVVRFFLQDDGGEQADVALKVQCIQRALNPINMALNLVEADNKQRIIDSARLMKSNRRQGQANVFVAHSFSSELLANLRDQLGRASNALEFLKFNYGDKNAGGGLLLNSLRDSLAAAGIALYEVSVPNNNVYFEIGLGLGMNLPGLLFRRKQVSEREAGLPRLLGGLNRIDYSDYSSLLEGLSPRLEQSLHRFTMEGRESPWLYFLGLERPDCPKRTPYVLVLDHDRFGDRRDYRKHLEAAIPETLKIVYGFDQNSALDNCITLRSGTRSTLLDLWCAVKHADAVVFRSEHFGNDATASQTFIGAGIAFGIEHPQIHMTMLSEEPFGETLKLPADLAGWSAIEYQRLSDLTTGLGKALSIFA